MNNGSQGYGQTTSGVVAFGKHPGWPDHMDDVGTATAALIHLKRFLYLDGIRGLVDRGRLANIPQDYGNEAIRHEFLWVAPGVRVCGRMWSSQDAKNRSHYPMVVALDHPGLNTGPLLDGGQGILETLEITCCDNDGADVVREAVRTAAGQLYQLEQRAGSLPAVPAWYATGRTPIQLFDDAALGPNGTGLLRILYRMDREMPDALRGAPTAPNLSEARHLRLPALTAAAGRISLGIWFGLLRALTQPQVPLFLCCRIGGDLVDAILGDPLKSDFSFLIAGRDAQLPITEIPYQLPPDFVANARGRIGGLSSPAVWPAILNDTAPTTEEPKSRVGSLLSKLGIRRAEVPKAGSYGGGNFQ